MEIDDNYILTNCLRKDGQINRYALNEDIEYYLKHRYNDIPPNLFTYSEVIMRIKNNINNRPTCLICGAPVKYIGRPKIHLIYGITCSKKCANIKQIDTIKKRWENMDEDTLNKMKEKSKQTCIERYGVEYSFQSENNKEKSRQTCMEKYGEPTYGQFGSKSYKDNMIKKYGTDCPQHLDFVKEKISKALSSTEAQNKMKQTCLNKYGVEYISQLADIQNKIIETYKRNNTFNSSKDEEILLNMLNNIFNSVEIQYASDSYPYKCDFYISDLNLYIEYQGSMFHNGCLYNENLDKNEYNTILLKCNNIKSNRYNNLINTWIKRDIEKWNIAKQNKLNMLFIYPKFHKNWIYYKYHNKNGNNIEMYNDILNYLKEFIYNNYKNKQNIQLVIGEKRNGN